MTRVRTSADMTTTHTAALASTVPDRSRGPADEGNGDNLMQNTRSRLEMRLTQQVAACSRMARRTAASRRGDLVYLNEETQDRPDS